MKSLRPALVALLCASTAVLAQTTSNDQTSQDGTQAGVTGTTSGTTVPPGGIVPTTATATAGNSIILTLANVPLQDASGSILGRLEYLVVTPNGQIDLGLLQMGGRFVPLPWQLVSTAPNTTGVANRPMFRVPLDRARLTQAPAVQQTGFSQLLVPGGSAPFYAHFGLQANPAIGGTGTVGAGVVTGSGIGPRAAPGLRNSIGGLTNRVLVPPGTPAAGTDAPFVSPGAPRQPVDPTRDNRTGVDPGLAPPGQPTPPPQLPPGPLPDATPPITPNPVPPTPAPGGAPGGAVGGGAATGGATR